jgi:hypothetical protein
VKRWLLLLVLVAAGAAGGHALYTRMGPKMAPSRCALEWLRTQLVLSPEQFAKIEEIHKRRWPEIRRLKAESPCEGKGVESCRKACKAATMTLIDEVCTVLTPEQQADYRRLVAPCGKEDGSCR